MESETIPFEMGYTCDELLRTKASSTNIFEPLTTEVARFLRTPV